jgi:hypothetical protein
VSRRLLLALGAALALAALAAPALAITGGRADGNEHPNVGLLVADVDGTGPRSLCSGTLVAPAVFLTAGHCTASLPTTRVAVTFEPAPDLATAQLVSGTAVTDPAFGHDRGDLHDLAVVLLDAPVGGITPATLPAPGLLDRSQIPSATFTSVGYGYAERAMGGGRPHFLGGGERRVATTTFAALTRSWLKLSSRGGGLCFGDSGGPQFLGDSSVVVATTSGGSSTCEGSSSSYRLDTPSARGFLGRYVALPA